MIKTKQISTQFLVYILFFLSIFFNTNLVSADTLPLNDTRYIRIVARQIKLASLFGIEQNSNIKTLIKNLHTDFRTNDWDLYNYGLKFKKYPRLASHIDTKIRNEVVKLSKTDWLKKYHSKKKNTIE